MQLRLKYYPDSILTKPSQKVSVFDTSVERLARNMLDMMYKNNGIGLAAPQVGVAKDIIVIDASENKNKPMVLINPKIVWESEEKIKMVEGCLSFKDKTLEIERPAGIKVIFKNLKGKKEEISAWGIWARVLFHEIDHLSGILFIDRQ